MIQNLSNPYRLCLIQKYDVLQGAKSNFISIKFNCKVFCVKLFLDKLVSLYYS